MYTQSRNDQEPFRQNSLTASNQIMALLGLGQAAPAQTAPGTPTAPTGSVPAGAPPGFREAAGTGVGVRSMDGQLRGNFQGLPGYVHGGVTANTGGPGQVSQAPPQTPEQQRQAAFDLWRGTPGYQFNLDEGRKQLESSAAARGGLYSGAALKDLTQYGQNYADRTYGDHMNRLAGVAGQAQTINAQNAAMGQNYANNAGANLMHSGAQRASGLYQQGQNNAQFTAGAFGLANQGLQGWLQKNQWGGI